MLSHRFDSHTGILYLNPTERLEKSDFETLAYEIDPYIEKNGKINGILITANQFPYWRDFEALVTHFKFVRDHHREIKKVAIVSDIFAAFIVPALANHFVSAKIKHFQRSDRKLAEAWIENVSEARAS